MRFLNVLFFIVLIFLFFVSIANFQLKNELTTFNSTIKNCEALPLEQGTTVSAYKKYTDYLLCGLDNALIRLMQKTREHRNEQKIGEARLKTIGLLTKIKTKLEQDKARLVQDKTKLTQENTRLAQDKAKLAQENTRLAQDKAKLTQNKAKLTQDNVTLERELEIQNKRVEMFKYSLNEALSDLKQQLKNIKWYAKNKYILEARLTQKKQELNNLINTLIIFSMSLIGFICLVVILRLVFKFKKLKNSALPKIKKRTKRQKENYSILDYEIAKLKKKGKRFNDKSNNKFW